MWSLLSGLSTRKVTEDTQLDTVCCFSLTSQLISGTIFSCLCCDVGSLLAVGMGGMTSVETAPATKHIKAPEFVQIAYFEEFSDVMSVFSLCCSARCVNLSSLCHQECLAGWRNAFPRNMVFSHFVSIRQFCFAVMHHMTYNGLNKNQLS